MTCAARVLHPLLVLLVAARLAGAPPPAQEVRTRGGVVVAAEGEAARAGAAILASGGNATDAAVATAFALAVTWPQAGNVGGGGFWISRNPQGRLLAVDFRETAPAASTRDMFERAVARGADRPSLRGALSSGVPGSVAGLWLAHRHGGRLPWGACLRSAVRLARDGFDVSRSFHDAILDEQEKLAAIPEAAAIFLPGGAPPAVGSRFRQPALAASLERIADHGAEGFYLGPVAEALADWSSSSGGLITRSDLAAYRAIIRKPLVFRFAGHEIATLPPPAGGATLAAMAGMMDALGLGRFCDESPGSLHLLAEIERRAFFERNRRMGDPAFSPFDLEAWLDPAQLARLAASIDPRRATPSRDLAEFGEARFSVPDPPHTTHFSVVDAEGGAVAVTTTLNDNFGSGQVVPGTGILMNDEMDDFATRPGEPNLFGLVQGESNAVEPGKRMLSSMSPAIAWKDRKVRLVWGSPGGSTILTTNLQILWRTLLRGSSLREAIEAPRFHRQDWPDQVDFESGFPEASLAALVALGHERGRQRRLGQENAIEILPDGTRVGVADRRLAGATAASADFPRVSKQSRPPQAPGEKRKSPAVRPGE